MNMEDPEVQAEVAEIIKATQLPVTAEGLKEFNTNIRKSLMVNGSLACFAVPDSTSKRFKLKEFYISTKSLANMKLTSSTFNVEGRDWSVKLASAASSVTLMVSNDDSNNPDKNRFVRQLAYLTVISSDQAKRRCAFTDKGNNFAAIAFRVNGDGIKIINGG